MISAQQLDALDPQTRQPMLSLMAGTSAKDALTARSDHDIAFNQAPINKHTHDMVVLKRLKFTASSERFAITLALEQKSLLEETPKADLPEPGRQIERERGKACDEDKTDKKTSKPPPLLPHLQRRDVAHEPIDTSCGCGQPKYRPVVSRTFSMKAGVVRQLEAVRTLRGNAGCARLAIGHVCADACLGSEATQVPNAKTVIAPTMDFWGGVGEPTI